MGDHSRTLWNLCAVTLAAALALGAATRPASSARTRLGPLADRPRSGGRVALHLVQPTVRIGLTGDGRSVTLEAGDGLYVVDRDSGRDVWKHIHRGILRVVLERRGTPAPAPIFSVQVASLGDEEEAEALKERLQTETGEVATITRNPDRNAWRVRVGRRATRDEIKEVEEKVRALGFAEIWVVQEPGVGGRHPRMRLVDEDYNDMVSSAKALLVLPAAEGRPVKVADVAYRGVIEILLTGSHELQAVNVLNLEDYLKGVVPKELGPTVYSELEALKAQAVAARTYMAANRGQFSEDGFDICDSARCQVYGGVPAEHPLSDAAVEATGGVIATFEGRPINALYTSTCGGHTEDLRNVFPEMRGPYLKGVRCYPDDATLAATRRTLRGVWAGPPILSSWGERLDEAAAVLEVLGVITAQEATPKHLAGFPTASEVGGWTSRALAAAGRRSAGGDPARQLPEVTDLAQHLVETLGWSERLSIMVMPADLRSLLGDDLLSETPEKTRPALAYLIKEDLIPRLRPGDPVSRGLLARALHRVITRHEATRIQTAKYRGSRGEMLGLQSDGTLTFYPPASRLHLFQRTDTAWVPLSEHVLQDGDNVEYHLSADGRIDLLVFRATQRGASDDRFSNLSTWEVRVPREEMETRIRTRASIGRLVDLVPGQRGPSGRLIDLTVVGSAGRFTFRGFNIERLLGLRETLFVLDRQLDDEGKVATFIFAGRGWGHGVGMCQVGAYGMALRGRSYEEILHHYYTGVTLEKAPAR